MAQYYRVRPKYWKGDRRRWSDQEKLLGLYLLTCDHRNLEGLYWLPKGYVSSDLGWPMRTIDRAFETLIAAGFCEYDEIADVVFVTAALAHQAPTTEKQVQGAVSALESVPDTSLWNAFMVACRAAAPKLAAALSDETRGPSGSHPNGNASASLSDPDTAGEPARTRSSSSSSSSNSVPPLPPEGEQPGEGNVVTFDRRPVPTARLELATSILDEFNRQAGTSYGKFTGRGRPSEDLRRIIGALTDATPPLDFDEAQRMIAARLAAPFWDGRPHTGVVFGPKVFASNRESATGSNGTVRSTETAALAAAHRARFGDASEGDAA